MLFGGFVRRLLQQASMHHKPLLTRRTSAEEGFVLPSAAKTIPWMPKPNRSPSLILRLSAYC